MCFITEKSPPLSAIFLSRKWLQKQIRLPVAEIRYKLITRQVETRPAQREQEIPAKTQTIQRRVLVKDETTRKVTIPAVYKEVTKKVLVKKGV